jgi:uncharacterized lipoprotein YehR (DUF1307 family)
MKPLERTLLSAALLAVLCLALAGCGSKLQGTYQNENGMIVVELRSGGKARVTMMGDSEECTYEVKGDKVRIDCKGEDVEFTVLDDGSLSGGGFIGTLKKSKS